MNCRHFAKEVEPVDAWRTGGEHRHDGATTRQRLSLAGTHAEGEIFRCLLEGEYCSVVVGQNQASFLLAARLVQRLSEAGNSVVRVDLRTIRREATPEHWYSAMLNAIAEQQHLENEVRAFWLAKRLLSPLQRFFGALRDVLLVHSRGPLIIVVEKLEALRDLPFSADEFMAAIRQCYNGRTEDPDLEQLSFCLLGTDLPANLLSETSVTPFNIGRQFDLSSEDISIATLYLDK